MSDERSTAARLTPTDVLVVGSGGAGLRAAIEARAAGARVVLITKGGLRASNTRMSAGRYNAVTGIDPDDSTDRFYRDTLAGGKTNDPGLARVLVDEALDRAQDLESYGLIWDRAPDGGLRSFGSPGCSRPRAIVPLDEGTGFGEVLLHQCWRVGVQTHELQQLVDVVLDDGGHVAGAIVLDLRSGEWLVYECPAVVIATGGTSELYTTSSGTALNTGDGLAAACRAGAELIDMELMQFIPIAFVSPPTARGSTLTEPHNYGMRAVDPQGEPAKLLNTDGDRFMLRHDPTLREAASREVIARAIMLEIVEGRGTLEGGVWLEPDPRALPAFLRGRRPFVKRILENYGQRAARFEERFQVTPSAFYTLGGIRIDEHGASTVPGLFAAGEAAGGVHGASQLGANSLPDTQVFGRRAGLAAAGVALERTGSRLAIDARVRDRIAGLERPLATPDGTHPIVARTRLQVLMWERVGLVRSAAGLTTALAELDALRHDVLTSLRATSGIRVLNRDWQEAIEFENMLDVAGVMARSALAREASFAANGTGPLS